MFASELRDPLFQRYLADGLFSDVSLLVPTADGSFVEFKAHKMLLTSKSRYFAMLFTHGFKEQYEKSVTLPCFFDALGFSTILQHMYGYEFRLPTVEILPKLLEMCDYLDLPRATEIGLMMALNSKIQNMQHKDWIKLYASLKEMIQSIEQFQHRGQLKETCGEVIRHVEDCLCANIKEIVEYNNGELLDLLQSDTTLNLLEASLSYVCDNTTLGIVLEEIRKRMKAISLFQLLALVRIHLFSE